MIVRVFILHGIILNRRMLEAENEDDQRGTSSPGVWGK